MDNLIRFACPKCGKALKAPPEFAGRVVRCARPTCRERLEVPEPLPDEELPDPPPRRRPPADRPAPRRRSAVGVWAAVAAVIVLSAAGGGAYWLFGKPSSKHEQLYRDYLRVGNDLAEMNAAREGRDVSQDELRQLHDKAQEHLDLRDRIQALPPKERDTLGQKYKAEMAQLKSRLLGLVKDYEAGKLPVVVVWASFPRPDAEVDLLPDHGEAIVYRRGEPTKGGASGLASGKPRDSATTAEEPAPLPPVKTARRPLGERDAALEGDWRAVGLFRIYTGREKDELSVSGEHTVSIARGRLTVSGSADGKKTTVAYDLDLDPSAEPKRFTITNPANADDYESGIYWVEKDTLLMRAEKFGPAAPPFDFSGVSITKTNASGRDSDIPKGFLRRRGDKGGSVLKFTRAGSAGPKPARQAPPTPAKQSPGGLEKFLTLADVVGTWDGPDFSFSIEADGKGRAAFSVPDGGQVHVLIGYYTVDTAGGHPRIAFTLTAAKDKNEFEFLLLSKPTPDGLVVKESKDRIKPNPVTLNRRKSRTPPHGADAKSTSPADFKGKWVSSTRHDGGNLILVLTIAGDGNVSYLRTFLKDSKVEGDAFDRSTRLERSGDEFTIKLLDATYRCRLQNERIEMTRTGGNGPEKWSFGRSKD